MRRLFKNTDLRRFLWTAMQIAFAMILAALTARAQSGIERPQLGWMLDSTGNVRAVFGVPGATTLGDLVLSGALTMGCSARRCLAKTDSTLVAFSGVASADNASDTSTDAPPGPALFAMDGDAVWVYFVRSQQVFELRNGSLNPVAFSPDGEVLSLRASSNAVDFAIRRADGVWIERLSTLDGTISKVDSLPRRCGPNDACAIRRAVRDPSSHHPASGGWHRTAV